MKIETVCFGCKQPVYLSGPKWDNYWGTIVPVSDDPCLETPHICDDCRQKPRILREAREAMDRHTQRSLQCFRKASYELQPIKKKVLGVGGG